MPSAYSRALRSARVIAVRESAVKPAARVPMPTEAPLAGLAEDVAWPAPHVPWGAGKQR
jgi:hypothetical protein